MELPVVMISCSHALERFQKVAIRTLHSTSIGVDIFFSEILSYLNSVFVEELFRINY